MGRHSLRAAAIVSVLLGAVPDATAQTRPASTDSAIRGRIEIAIKDDAGQPIASLKIEASGLTRASTLTTAAGIGYLAELPAGTYTLQVGRPGDAVFTFRDVLVDATRPIAMRITIRGAAATAEFDDPLNVGATVVRDLSVSTTFVPGEMHAAPTSRDPWGLIQQVPGVVFDRPNVGGLEPQQPNLVVKGAFTPEHVWTLNGIPITDMNAIGLSPTYYDFDALQRVSVTTGGADVRRATVGAGIDLVTGSGTRQRRADGRMYFSPGALQSENVTGDLTGQVPVLRRLDRSVDAGFDAGGPLRGDKLFGWFGYAVWGPRLDVSSFNPETQSYDTFVEDHTTVHDVSARAAWKPAGATRLGLTYFLGAKTRTGRDAGATRTAETTVKQTGPVHVVGVEWQKLASPSLWYAFRYGHVQHRLTLEPAGGRDAVAFLDDAGVWHDTFRADTAKRPQDSAALEGIARLAGQTLMFGGGWRRASVDALSTWPGGQLDQHVGYPIMFAQAVRDLATKGHTDYLHANVADTIRAGSLTLTAGLRLDRQAGSIDAVGVGANALAPAELPAASVAAQSNAIVWTTASPRLNASIALTPQTTLRGSYGWFATQMPSDLAAQIGGLPLQSIAFFSVADRNGNQIFDPADTSAFVGTDVFATRIGDYATPRTEEATASIDRDVAPGITVSATYTWRRWSRLNWVHIPGVTGSDFIQSATFSGDRDPVGAFSVPVFAVNVTSLPDDLAPARVFESRDGYRQQYNGVELGATFRMSGWTGRLSISGGAAREHFDSVDAVADPTPVVPGGTLFNPNGSNLSGGLLVRDTTGTPEQGIFLTSPAFQWSLTANGPLAWDVRLGLNVSGRQGFPAVYFRSLLPGSADATSPSGKSVLLQPDVEAIRLPAINLLDLRFSRDVRAGGRTFTVDVDVFNLFNRATPIVRGFDLRLASFDRVLETTAPRVVRFGVRFRL
jgi:hypothetical protein